MRLAWVLTLFLSGLAALGCPATLPSEFDDEPTTSTSGAPTTGESTPTSSASGLVTTTATPDTSVGPNDDTGDTSTGGPSTGDPASTPKIVEVKLDPNPLTAPGPIAVTVTTEFAQKVTMTVDGATGGELGSPGADLFTGEVVFQSYLDNGSHTATFVPHGEGPPGYAADVPIAINLPDGGGEIFWEAIGILGKGQVAALAVLPDGDVVEFGTLMETSECYLRRRRPTGAWMKSDVQVLADTPCTAIDVAATPEGALYLLMSPGAQEQASWQLLRVPTFGAEPAYVGAGKPKEVAYALALGSDRAAVCGKTPGLLDTDAAAWMFSYKGGSSALAFDYTPVGAVDKHRLSEAARDCVFAGDTLALVGEVYGKHDPNNMVGAYLNRLFLLEYDVPSQIAKWTVDGDPKDMTLESGSRAIALDPKGGYFVGGHSCPDKCGAMLPDLRRYAPGGGAPTWSIELAPQLAPARALAWHPGGYLVFVSMKADAQWESAFFVQAWQPPQYPALWSYDKKVAPTMHEATSIVIGPFGQVYTGGRGSDGFPAVAFIYG